MRPRTEQYPAGARVELKPIGICVSNGKIRKAFYQDEPSAIHRSNRALTGFTYASSYPGLMETGWLRGRFPLSGSLQNVTQPRHRISQLIRFVGVSAGIIVVPCLG